MLIASPGGDEVGIEEDAGPAGDKLEIGKLPGGAVELGLSLQEVTGVGKSLVGDFHVFAENFGLQLITLFASPCELDLTIQTAFG